MITIKKSENGKRFVMTDGQTVLGSVSFLPDKGEIISYEINDPAFEFVFVNLTKAVLNFFDLNGVQTVRYFGEENLELLKKQGFAESDGCLTVNLEGYFDKKCCGQKE